MTINIDKINSHGKAKILSYGHPNIYKIPISLSKEEIKAGFIKSEWHYDKIYHDETSKLIHESYPLSPEEQIIEDEKKEKENYLNNLPDVVKELTEKVNLLEKK